jgi:hypothetical protein
LNLASTSLREILSRRAVRFDDLFGQQVRQQVFAARHVRRKQVIERAVFSDNHNDMLDRSLRFLMIGLAVDAGVLAERRPCRQQQRQHRSAHSSPQSHSAP